MGTCYFYITPPPVIILYVKPLFCVELPKVVHPKAYKDSYVATRLVEVSTTLIVTADVIPVSGGDGGVSGCVVEPEVVPEVEPVVEPEVVPEVEPEVVPEVEPEVVPEVEPEVVPVGGGPTGFVEPDGVEPVGGDVGGPDGAVEPDVVPEVEPEVVPEVEPEVVPEV